MAVVTQDDFGAGIYRGRRAPRDAVYDAVNALLDDEGQLFRRGGSAYKTPSNVAAATLVGIADAVVAGTAVTLVWTQGSGEFWRVDDAGAATLIPEVPTVQLRPFARGAGVGDYWIAAIGVGGRALLYDGVSATISTYPMSAVEFVTAVGSPARLIATVGSRAYFSNPGDPTAIASGSYHELPNRAVIVGADSIGDSVVLFTTMGVWAVTNMSLDPVDDAGNIQHTVQRVSDLILWGDPGITGYAGRLIVPAIDDVWLFAPGEPPQPVSGDSGNEKIRPLYRSYVKAGYQPGTAAMHRGHYFLPIVNGTTLVDVLVCRLDRGAAWTRWSGHAAAGAYAVRIGSGTRSPKLLGINGTRVTDLTACMDSPGAASDADGSTPTFTVDSNDFELGPAPRGGTLEKVRATYETTGGSPTVDAYSAVGPEGSGYTAATLKRGGGASDGTDYSAWRVGRRGPRARVRLQCSSAVTSLLLRRVELTVRPVGG